MLGRLWNAVRTACVQVRAFLGSSSPARDQTKPLPPAVPAPSPFPATCLRGLVSSRCRDGNQVRPEAFEENKKTAEKRREDGRKPDGTEASINWEEKPEALALLRQSDQSKHGIARLSLDALEKVGHYPGLENCLHWEYHRLKRNPYHGNIVYLEGVMKPRKLAIQHMLAQAAKIVEDENAA